MQARYRTNKITRAASLSTANKLLQFDASFSSLRTSHTQQLSQDTDQRAIPYPSALSNASQHRRACKIVFISHHASFTLRNVIMIPTFRALAVPHLSENFVMYRSWDETGEAAHSQGGICDGKE